MDILLPIANFYHLCIKILKMKLTITTFLLVMVYAPLVAQIIPEKIDIVRDKWGVPHIYAPTDAEVAYGFGWASAEDDSRTMQLQLLPVRGLMGQVLGKEGAVGDVLVHLLEAEEIVERRYSKDISPAFRAYLEAYAAGVTSYLKKHPKELLHKKLLPITGKDIAKAFVMGVSLMANVQKDLVALLQNKIQPIEIPKALGSNAFAFQSHKTTDGKTYLAINSHQPLEGPNSWYEAHLCSEEGMNILGACFAGSPVITVGTNEQLGWAHTVNYGDFSDVFQLEMHPKKKLHYRFDNEWIALEKFPVKARIKILGFLKVGKKQKFYKSKYGVTFETETGFFALRFPANTTIQSPEQWFRMSKANNWEEFKSALDMQALPAMNLVYADREDNIFYLSNGLLPKRKRGYDWKGVVPGNTSATLWGNDFYPIDSLPHLLNPASGYVYNCNHTPFISSSDADNPKVKDVPSTTGYQLPESLTNRAVRFEELIEPYDKVSYEDFKKIKYDRSYNKPLRSAPKLEAIFQLSEEKYPDLKESIQLLKNWDREATVESEGATLFITALRYIQKRITDPSQFRKGNTINEALLVKAVRHARQYCQQHFGAIHVPLKRLQRHTRGSVNLPVSGGPDVLAALAAREQPDGTIRASAGDSYIELVRFSESGVEIETVNAFGASAKPNSPHYTDQMQLYVDQKLKPMTLDKEQVYKEAVRVYHPE